jgi:hypothetical protein
LAPRDLAPTLRGRRGRWGRSPGRAHDQATGPASPLHPPPRSPADGPVARRSVPGQVDSAQMDLGEIAGGLRSIQTAPPPPGAPGAGARGGGGGGRGGDAPWGWLVPGEGGGQSRWGNRHAFAVMTHCCPFPGISTNAWRARGHAHRTCTHTLARARTHKHKTDTHTHTHTHTHKTKQNKTHHTQIHPCAAQGPACCLTSS